MTYDMLCHKLVNAYFIFGILIVHEYIHVYLEFFSSFFLHICIDCFQHNHKNQSLLLLDIDKNSPLAIQ